MTSISNNPQNRHARRANKKTFKKKGKTVKSNWGEWENKILEVKLDGGLNNYLKNNSSLKDMVAFWVNNYVSVQVCSIVTKDGKVLRAGIRRHDEKTNITWGEKQRIKNELFGQDALGVEVFPRENDLVDHANMYWLWILPENYELPFSL